MKIGVLGTGDVGKALGRGFITLGHEVKMGSRDEKNEKALEWVRNMERNASAGTFSDAAGFGDYVVLATLGIATEQVIKMAGPEKFNGKLVIDATNPLEFAGGVTKLVGAVGNSGGEKHQKLIPNAHVVKCFNTVGNNLMFQPNFPGTKPDMFFCGNDESAKQKTAKICSDFGWNSVDVGGISSAHYLESMCMVWVLSAVKTNNWNQAFKLLRK